MKVSTIFALAMPATTLAWQTTFGYNEKKAFLDIGEGLYSPDEMEKLFVKVIDNACDVNGCSDALQQCDNFFCMTVDANLYSAGQFEALIPMAYVVKNAVAVEKYDRQTCNPMGSCGTTRHVKLTWPQEVSINRKFDNQTVSFSIKTTITKNTHATSCSVIVGLLTGVIGELDGGSALGTIAPLICNK